MFNGATSFEGIGLETWDVSNLQDMGNMFRSTPNLNADLSAWVVSNVHHMNSLFQESGFNGDVPISTSTSS